MNWVKFKGVIDFIKGLMNEAAFDLASRKELCQAVGKQRFIMMERGQKKEIISEECIVSGKVTLRKERESACQVGYLAVLTRLIAG